MRGRMIELQQRQKQIVKLLINSDDYQPVKIIAQHLNCSTKTIRNDLNLIEEQGINVEKKSGKGIKISVKTEDRMNLNLIINNEDNNGFNDLSAESRRIKILFDLLDNNRGNISIQTLAQKYFVSKTSIVNDLKCVEKKISKYNLCLEKSIQGTSIIGNEIDIRKLMVSVLNNLVMSKEKLINLEKSKRIDDITLDELSKQFSEENVRYVEQIIEEIESILDYKIGEPYYINIITHILILINRTQSGNRIYELENFKDIDIKDEFIYAISKEMAKKIENHFSIILKSEEVYFIYRYLLSSGTKVSSQNSLTEKLVNEDDIKISNMAKEMIKICSEALEVDLTFDTQLYSDLILHLRPMLNRINYNIMIKNPLIEEIKEELPEIMGLLKIVMLKISKEFGLADISEDEIGYIAVYFQVAIEQTINKKRVIIVCSTGVGTSHLLKNRIKNHFPDWNIVDVTSANYLEKKLDLSDIDLIVSTVKLKNSQDLSKPIAYITALFNNSDLKIIKELLVREKIIKEIECKFDKIREYLRSQYINIFEKSRWKNSEDCAISKRLSLCKEKNKLIQSIRLKSNFNIYLYEKNNLLEPCIGINILKNYREESKIQLILMFNKSDYIAKELIIELYKLFIKDEKIQKLCKCNTSDEILREFV